MMTLLLPILLLIVVFAIVKQTKKKEQNTFFSITSITKKLVLLIQRFPISLLFLIGLAILFCITIASGKDNMFSYKLWLFFSGSVFIGISITLWLEDVFNYIKTHLFSFLTILIWGVYIVLLPDNSSDIQIAKGLEFKVISAAIFLSMFFINFLGKNKNHSFWNFSQHLFSQMAVAYFFGLILFGGLSLALVAIESLFYISIDGNMYMYLAVMSFVVLSPIYFLAHIPHKTEKYNDDIECTPIQRVLALYIFLPVLAVYMGILYIYMLKIIVMWELPNGWVSWLVSALALGGLLVIALLYPLREQENNKTANSISRWLVLLILPLLTLMTVGIMRRISDYGITINRVYILLLNIWFCGIYIYLFFTKLRAIKWILISPIVVAIMSSISWWGVANITQTSLTHEVEAILPQKVSFEYAKNIFANMDKAELERAQSVFTYLYEHFGKESVQPFFTDEVANNYWDFLFDIDLKNINNSSKAYEYINYTLATKGQAQKIKNYNTFRAIDYDRYNDEQESEWGISYTITKDTLKISADNQTFVVPVKNMAVKYLEMNGHVQESNKAFIFEEKDYKIIINEFYGDYFKAQDSVSIDRLDADIFYNKK